MGLTEGCVGCCAIAEGKRAQGHAEGCRARLEAELAKTDDGRVRLTTAHLKGLARDEERGTAASAGATPANSALASSCEVQDVPMDADAGEQAPMDVGSSRKRSAEEAGHEAGDSAWR